MAYSFDDFMRDVDQNLLALVCKNTSDFPGYEFEADFYSDFPASFAAQQAILASYNNNLKARLNPSDYLNREFVAQSCDGFGVVFADTDGDYPQQLDSFSVATREGTPPRVFGRKIVTEKPPMPIALLASPPSRRFSFLKHLRLKNHLKPKLELEPEAQKLRQ